jgi:predicted transposase YbfD/YdcC
LIARPRKRQERQGGDESGNVPGEAKVRANRKTTLKMLGLTGILKSEKFSDLREEFVHSHVVQRVTVGGPRRRPYPAFAWRHTYGLDAVLIPAVRQLIGAATKNTAAVERLRAACVDYLRSRSAEPSEAPRDGGPLAQARANHRNGSVRSAAAVKDNQPTLHAEIESYFATAPVAEVEKAETIGKDHGRFELRNYSVSHQVDWYAAERSYPGAPRFAQLTTIAMVESRFERVVATLSAAAFAAAARGHWAIENKLHWVLDVTFARICHACALATVPPTWRWCDTSPSIWSAKSQTNGRSSDAASAPPGTHNTCWKFSGRCGVNLDSLP